MIEKARESIQKVDLSEGKAALEEDFAQRTIAEWAHVKFGLNLDLHCVMDGDLWLRMFRHGTTWGHLPQYLAAFRQHAAAKNSTWLTKYKEEYQYVFRTYPEYFAPTLKHKLGPNLYRLSQIVSGRQALATLDTRRSVRLSWRPPPDY